MLLDAHGRQFPYLRLSLTEKCNFSCSYCLPEGYVPCGSETFLNLHEIRNLVRGFLRLGVKKIRLTGGEPTLRGDFLNIVSLLKKELGVPELSLTTNGFRLSRVLEELKARGLDGLNVSLDSLSPQRFQDICGSPKGFEVKESILRALDLGFKKVKVNVVLLKGLNDHEMGDYLEWVRTKNLSVRFIELMRTLDNEDYFLKHHLSPKEIERGLKLQGWKEIERGGASGPAREYSHPDFLGRMGFISAYSRNFCLGCNRLRISARGALRLCLFGEGQVDLRSCLQDVNQEEKLLSLVLRSLAGKSRSHELHRGWSGDMASLSAIGG